QTNRTDSHFRSEISSCDMPFLRPRAMPAASTASRKISKALNGSEPIHVIAVFRYNSVLFHTLSAEKQPFPCQNPRHIIVPFLVPLIVIEPSAQNIGPSLATSYYHAAARKTDVQAVRHADVSSLPGHHSERRCQCCK